MRAITADQFIKSYWDTRESINADLKLIEDLKGMTLTIGSIDYSKERIVGSGYYTGASFEDIVIKTQDRINEIENRVKSHMDALAKIEEILRTAGLTRKEKTVLTYIYLTHMTIEETASRMYYSTRNIIRIQKRALRKLREIEMGDDNIDG